MSTVCEKHGKPIATKEDMAEYEQRKACVRRGDCDCHICSQLCWEFECERAARSEEKKPKEGER